MINAVYDAFVDLVIVGAATTLRKDNLYFFSVPGTSFTLDLSAFLRAYIVLLVVGKH